MACNKCKKKSDDSGKVKTILPSNGFQLRTGITYDQIGISNPSDENIIAFLNENPNRIGLFVTYPRDWNNMKKDSNE
jgi:hypothetical protein